MLKLLTIMKERSTYNFQLPLMAGIYVVAFAALAYWAGFPKEKFLLFAAGAAVLIGGMAVYAVLIWHLLFRPLPVSVQKPVLALLPEQSRKLIAVLLTIA